MVGGYKNPDGRSLEYCRISSSTVILKNDTLFLDDHVFIGHFNFIDSSQRVTIGKGCQFTNYISILNHSSHDAIRLYGESFVKTSEPKKYNHGTVEIGEFTFIGPHSVIMPGTRIGKGSIVSAFSMVQGEFPDYSIISGNPAKVVGSTDRRDERMVTRNPEFAATYYRSTDWGKESE